MLALVATCLLGPRVDWCRSDSICLELLTALYARLACIQCRTANAAAIDNSLPWLIVVHGLGTLVCCHEVCAAMPFLHSGRNPLSLSSWLSQSLQMGN